MNQLIRIIITIYITLGTFLAFKFTFQKQLKQKELLLLPNKRKRALNVAQSLIDKHFKKAEGDIPRRRLISNLKRLFDIEYSGEQGIVDYYNFAQNWLDILQPILNSKRKQSRNKRYVYGLGDLTEKEVPLPNEQLENLYKNCPYTETIDAKVAACIIGISDTEIIN